MTEQEFHRKMAVDLFNATWDLIDKADRSPEDDDEMVHMAHASRYHWSRRADHQAVHIARGEWQISHVYAILGRAETALHHARRSLNVCEAEGISGFDIAFAHEAMARAAASAGDRTTCETYFSSAQDLAGGIADADDRDCFLKQLRDGPWFGLVSERG